MKYFAALLMLLGTAQMVQAQNAVGALFNNIPAVPANVAGILAQQQPAAQTAPAPAGSSTAAPAPASVGSSSPATLGTVETPAVQKSQQEALQAFGTQLADQVAANPVMSTSDIANASPAEQTANAQLGSIAANITEAYNGFAQAAGRLVTKYATTSNTGDCAGIKAQVTLLNGHATELNAQFAQLRANLTGQLANFDAQAQVALASKSATVRANALAQIQTVFAAVQGVNGTLLGLTKEMSSMRAHQLGMGCN